MKKPKTILSQSVYSDSYLRVIHDKVTFNSHQWNQVYFDKVNKNSVMVVPEEKEGVYLVKQYRHPVQKFLWQFPAGTLEEGMTLLQLANKELKEEAGIVAKKMIKIGSFFAEPGLSTDKTTIYVAQHLTKLIKQQLDKSEVGMNICYLSLNEMDNLIKKGQIMCGITISAYLFFKLHFRKT